LSASRSRPRPSREDRGMRSAILMIPSSCDTRHPSSALDPAMARVRHDGGEGLTTSRHRPGRRRGGPGRIWRPWLAERTRPATGSYAGLLALPCAPSCCTGAPTPVHSPPTPSPRSRRPPTSCVFTGIGRSSSCGRPCTSSGTVVTCTSSPS
jgi:hypothetical protein